MTSSLVGSEMCIRDSYCILKKHYGDDANIETRKFEHTRIQHGQDPHACHCLLYTSDAADDM
eukprot:2760903-Prorocentrum_lima.AAC.1